jgi:hypothetical protein
VLAERCHRLLITEAYIHRLLAVGAHIRRRQGPRWTLAPPSTASADNLDYALLCTTEEDYVHCPSVKLKKILCTSEGPNSEDTK